MEPHGDLSDERVFYLLVDHMMALSSMTPASLGEILRELDLTEATAKLLWHLDPAAPEPLMSELAERLGCDPSTVTFLVSRLEKPGLLERRPSARDRRTRCVALTPHGVRARTRLVEATTHASPLARLTARERRQLLRLLNKARPGRPR